MELHPHTPPAGPPSLTAGPIDERDAFWCWAHTTAVLFEDHGPSVTSYLRTMIDEYDQQYERARVAMPAGHSSTAVAVARRDTYRDALRVLEQASEAADRLAARYDEQGQRPPSSQQGHEPTTYAERSS